MSGETVSQEETKNEQVDSGSQQLQEEIEKIKQPPPVSESLRELPAEERKAHPAVAPEMLQEGGDLRHDLTRDK